MATADRRRGGGHAPFALGVGTGEALNEIAAGGARVWPAFDERLARLREALRLIRALWSGDPVTFVGKYYTAEDAVIADLPAERVPVLVAAGGPKAARFAGATATASSARRERGATCTPIGRRLRQEADAGLHR